MDPVSLQVNASVALILYFARRYDQAIAEARKTLEMDPNYILAHRVIGKASVEKRLYDQAIAAFHQAIALGGSPLLKAELGHAYAISGQRDEAMKILHELVDLSMRGYVASFHRAIVHVGLGERDHT